MKIETPQKETVKNVFEKMVCDCCGWESDQEKWYNFDGNDFEITIKQEWSCTYDGCASGEDEYDLCPECFKNLEKIIKNKSLAKNAEKSEINSKWYKDKSAKILRDVFYRMKELKLFDSEKINYDNFLAIAGEIHANLLFLTGCLKEVEDENKNGIKHS
jgi:hypothetical protein